MATTQLFVELLVIGFGAIIWFVLLIVSVLGYSFHEIPSSVSAVVLTPILGIAYVLGIIIDRAAHGLFAPLDKKYRNKVFEKDATLPVAEKERYILTYSDPLRTQIVYNRSRLRVSRSWIINFCIIAFSFPMWNYRAQLFNVLQSSSVVLIFTFLALASFFVWRRLTIDHYKNINESFNFLTKYEAKLTQQKSGKDS